MRQKNILKFDFDYRGLLLSTRKKQIGVLVFWVCCISNAASVALVRFGNLSGRINVDDVINMLIYLKMH